MRRKVDPASAATGSRSTASKKKAATNGRAADENVADENVADENAADVQPATTEQGLTVVAAPTESPSPAADGSHEMEQYAAVVPYQGASLRPFDREAASVLLAPVDENDVEVRPDGLIYLPEIKYRRVLHRAFGPGAWTLVPVEISVSTSDNMLYYKGQLYVLGRFVSEAIGEQQYFPNNERMSYATAAESAKSNCLMRCCKDLGIASELWDPAFVRDWIARNTVEVWCVNVGTRDKGKKKKMWRKRTAPRIDFYPWQEEGNAPSQTNVAPPNAAPRSERRADGVPAGVEKVSAEKIEDHEFIQGVEELLDGERVPERVARPSVPRSPAPATRPISPKQADRLLKIARANDWSTEMIAAHLTRVTGEVIEDPHVPGALIAAAKGVPLELYDKACEALENARYCTSIKEQLAEEQARFDEPSVDGPGAE